MTLFELEDMSRDDYTPSSSNKRHTKACWSTLAKHNTCQVRKKPETKQRQPKDATVSSCKRSNFCDAYTPLLNTMVFFQALLVWEVGEQETRNCT